MKVSKREDFAIILMSTLAENYSKGYLSLSSIARKTRLSPLFLKHIALSLKNHGLIQSREGVRGGYRLAKKPQKINMAQIITAVSEGIVTPKCIDSECRIKKKDCYCFPFWDRFNRLLQNELALVKLADIIQK